MLTTMARTSRASRSLSDFATPGDLGATTGSVDDANVMTSWCILTNSGHDLARRAGLARLAPAAQRSRCALPQVRLLDDPQVADCHRHSILSAPDYVPDAVALDVAHRLGLYGR